MKIAITISALVAAVAGHTVILTPFVPTPLPANSALPLSTVLATNTQTLNLIGFYDSLPHATVTVTSMVLQEPSNDLIFYYSFSNHDTSSYSVGGASIFTISSYWKDAYSGLNVGGQDAIQGYDNLFVTQVLYGSNIYSDPCILPGTTGSAFFFRTNAPGYAMGSAQVFANDLATQSLNYYNVFVPVPEPSSAIVVVLGVGALVMRRRRR
jgi:hypothetical protein